MKVKAEISPLFQTGSKIILKSCHDTYLSAFSNGTISLSNSVKDAEVFTCWQESGKVSFQTIHKTFICATVFGSFSHQFSIGEWEKYSIIDCGNGKFAFQTFHSTFISAGKSGRVVQEYKCDDSEFFEVSFYQPPVKLSTTVPTANSSLNSSSSLFSPFSLLSPMFEATSKFVFGGSSSSSSSGASSSVQNSNEPIGNNNNNNNNNNNLNLFQQTKAESMPTIKFSNPSPSSTITSSSTLQLLLNQDGDKKLDNLGGCSSSSSDVISVQENDMKVILQLKKHDYDVLSVKPIDHGSFKEFFDLGGRIKDTLEFKQEIFYRGFSFTTISNENCRAEAWKFLLGYYPLNSTIKQREAVYEQKKQEYEVIKKQWTTISPLQASRNTLFTTLKHNIEKDVCRLDRTIGIFQEDNSPYLVMLNDILLTYAIYNADVGYCQGMGDLLTPIVDVMRDEVISFWCFAAIMERYQSHFQLHNSEPIEEQLKQLSILLEVMEPSFYKYLEEVENVDMLMCYRWILVAFRREFTFEDGKRLWDSLFSLYRGEQFQLFICLAMLKAIKGQIMDEHMKKDDILKLCNSLSGRINVEKILRTAEESFVDYQAQEQKILSAFQK